tara:strand:- start:88 stop:429 length:342 start_codon:yes stop_codon:yes gene_type:complete
MLKNKEAKKLVNELLDKIRLYCEYQLREVQTDNLYFGENRGSIYWVEGGECWAYLKGTKTQWGEADDLLACVPQKDLLFYYKDNKEDIDEFVPYNTCWNEISKQQTNETKELQ